MTDITIIIPTYNRPDYLKRILDYFGSFAAETNLLYFGGGNTPPFRAGMKAAEGTRPVSRSSRDTPPFTAGRVHYSDSRGDFEIIVADSSSKENKNKNRETIKSFSNITVSYLADYPEDINPWYKFEDVLKSVLTKYVVFCGDDDFVVPAGIKKAKEFLEENLDFTVAHGNYIGFFAKNNSFAWKVVSDFQSIELPDAQSRLVEHLSNYSISTFYGVHRTDFLKMIFEETRKFTNDNRFGELLPSVLTLIYGKMKKIDAVYAVHEINPQSTGLITDTLYDFKTAGTFGEKYDNFKKCLADHLVKNSELEIDEAKIVIDKAMSDYFERNYPHNFRTFLKDKIKEIFVFLPLIRSTYIAFNFYAMKNISKNLKNDPDFQKIKNCVEKYKVKKYEA